jgi:predicted protein tyrosine phosphatase
MREQLLFVCSRNCWRSPTAEAILRPSDRYCAKSAGTSDRARIKITPGLINWSDRIFVMEKRHLMQLSAKYPDLVANKSIVVLNITDDYGYMDEELIEILRSRLSEYLELE